MRDKLKDGILFAYYGKLLNEHQYEILQLYYDCDMSLSEISEIFGTTRQGVREIIIRSISKLEEYEKKLCLVLKLKKISNELERIINNIENKDSIRKQLELLLSEFKEI